MKRNQSQSNSGMVVLALLLLINAFIGVSADKILVITEDNMKTENYNQFWASLRSREHELKFRSVKEATPALKEFDKPAFDHLILFAPSSKHFAADLSPQALVQYLNDGGNILLAGSSDISEFWRDFVREFEIDFDDRSTAVMDHFQNHDQDPTKIYSQADSNSRLIEDEVIIPSSIKSSLSPILFRGIGHSIGKNPMLMSILRASPVAYSKEIGTNETDTNPFIIGDEIGLISGFQTRKQSRISFVGSIDFFSDDFFNAELTLPDGEKTPTGNKKVAERLSKWTFQELGVLRIISASHSKVNGEKEPSRYRINEEIEYKVDIQSLENGVWRPFMASDIQLEFTMLDPHLRVTLTPKKSKDGTFATYSKVFRAPDRHGVFTFNLDYRRRNGLTNLKNQLQVSVTPLEHDQYERFIFGAYPYYLGSLNVLIGFFIFSIVWLTHVPGRSTKN
ncbi:oligosaccharyltransferase 48K subunit, partial [Phakopsora pachyrhizi]